MKEQLYTLQEVIKDLAAVADDAGSLKHLGELLDPEAPISPGYLNDVLHGRKPPGPRILKARGFKRAEMLYRRIRPAVKS